MAGKLVVFEGTDGSGKSTQFSLLCKRLTEDKTEFRRLIFPQYSEPSSALLRMYLNGEFGTHPSDVNAYAASTFYAVDRYASYNKVWGNTTAAEDWYWLTGTPLPMRCIRGQNYLRRSGKIFSTGFLILNTVCWACPNRTL